MPSDGPPERNPEVIFTDKFRNLKAKTYKLCELADDPVALEKYDIEALRAEWEGLERVNGKRNDRRLADYIALALSNKRDDLLIIRNVMSCSAESSRAKRSNDWINSLIATTKQREALRAILED